MKHMIAAIAAAFLSSFPAYADDGRAALTKLGLIGIFSIDCRNEMTPRNVITVPASGQPTWYTLMGTFAFMRGPVTEAHLDRDDPDRIAVTRQYESSTPGGKTLVTDTAELRRTPKGFRIMQQVLDTLTVTETDPTGPGRYAPGTHRRVNWVQDGKEIGWNGEPTKQTEEVARCR